MNVPPTLYAKTVDGVHIAYQVLGEGPVDLVWVIGWTSNVDAIWEEPNLARFLIALSSFSRLILFDKRGVGLSDRVPERQLPSMETRMDDVRAVMDAAGSDRAVVFGVSEGGPMAMLFAATYPDRTIGLVLYGTDPDYTALTSEDPMVAAGEEYLEYIDGHWGTLEHARMEIATWGAPSHADDDQLVAWLASYLRRSGESGGRHRSVEDEPADRRESRAARDPRADADHRQARGRRVPHRGDAPPQIEDPGRSPAGAAGNEHFFWVAPHGEMLEAIESFVADLGAQEVYLERFLATVMFTDIVGSTEAAGRLGDRAWRDLLEQHHERFEDNSLDIEARDLDGR